MAGQKKMGWSDLRVGILVLASIFTLIVLILAVTGSISIFSDAMKLRTEMTAAEGLKTGDEVRLAGVPVGSVERVDFRSDLPASTDSTGGVLITMTLDEDIVRERIRDDSVVILRSVGLLGGSYLDITSGTQKGNPVKEWDLLKSRQEAKISDVVESSDDLLTGFKTLSTKLNEITDTINTGKGTIGRFINDESFYVNLNKVTLEAQDLVARIRDGNGTAGRLINDPKLYEDLNSSVNSLKTVVDQVSDGRGSIGKLIKEEEVYNNLNAAVAKLNAASDRAERITAQVETGPGTIHGLLYDEKLHKDATEAIASLKEVSARLDRGEGTAGKLLHDDQLYNNLNQLSAESVKLLYDFRQNPKKYLSIKVSLF